MPSKIKTMTGYISIREITDNLLAHPMLQDLNFERIINYAIHFMRKLGVPNTFVDKVVDLEVSDFKALLPCDFYKIIQIKKGPHVLRYTTDSFHMEPTIRKIEDGCCKKHPHLHRGVDLTYKLQGNVIYTNFKTGVITVSYQAILTDEDGYPLIPENSSYIEALEAFIKEKHFTILFDQGKIDRTILGNAKTEYAWAVGQAQTDLIIPSIDQMEAITNMWNTLIPRVQEHRRGFLNAGTKEYIKRQ